MSRPDYGDLARAISGFTDQLEAEANEASSRKAAAEIVVRSCFPELTYDEIKLRMRHLDARASALAETTVRLRKLLADIASRRGLD